MTSQNPALEQFIRSIPLFALIEPDEMMDILGLLRPATLTPGQVLFREGEAGDAFWVLGSGCEVSISTTPTGAKRPVVVAYARAGGTVGEMALVDDGARSATAVVMQGGPAHQIVAADFKRIRDQYHPAAFKVLRRICMDLCGRLRATRDRIAPAGQVNVSAPAVAAGRRPNLEVLDEFPALKPLPQVVKLALAQKLQLIELTEVTPLFAEGEPADAAYFLLSGEVTIGRGGKTFASLGPGSMFGLVSAIDEGRRSASAITGGPARLLRLCDADFDALFKAGNRFAFVMVELVARQLVAHLRHANLRLPGPGQPGVGSAAPRPARPPAPPAALEMLPLELDLDVELELLAMSSDGDLLSS